MRVTIENEQDSLNSIEKESWDRPIDNNKSRQWCCDFFFHYNYLLFIQQFAKIMVSSINNILHNIFAVSRASILVRRRVKIRIITIVYNL